MFQSVMKRMTGRSRRAPFEDNGRDLEERLLGVVDLVTCLYVMRYRLRMIPFGASLWLVYLLLSWHIDDMKPCTGDMNARHSGYLFVSVFVSARNRFQGRSLDSACEVK